MTSENIEIMASMKEKHRNNDENIREEMAKSEKMKKK